MVKPLYCHFIQVGLERKVGLECRLTSAVDRTNSGRVPLVLKPSALFLYLMAKSDADLLSLHRSTMKFVALALAILLAAGKQCFSASTSGFSAHVKYARA